jgi:hypothetical protein
VGRVYLSDQMIIARSLLEQYLIQNYEKFIYSVETISKKYVGDDIELVLHVFVDYKNLASDLKEKRFLYKPKYKPYFAIFIEEILSDEPASVFLAQQELTNVIRDRAVRLPEVSIMYPPSNVNITSSPDLLESALREAHKAGVELIITGTSETRLIKKEQLYYDFFYFYETDLNLKLMRSDTGEVLYESQNMGQAYSTDEQQAIKTSVAMAIQMVGNEIIDYYYETWNKIFLNEVDYQIMFTGVDDNGLELIKQEIEGLHPDTEVYTRSFYKNIAVLNVVDSGSADELQQLIKTSSFPNFRILEVSGKSLEAQKEY